MSQSSFIIMLSLANCFLLVFKSNYFVNTIQFAFCCIFFSKILHTRSMIVCAATLLFLLLIFAPFRVNLYAQIYLQRRTAKVQAKVCFLTVFDEEFVLKGKYLVCDGTVQTNIDIAQIDRKNGIDLLKCLTFDKVFVSLQNNLSVVSSKMILAENALTAIITNLACGFTHCQVASEVVACTCESRVCSQIAVSTSVAELSFCLLKQGVQLWMRKLAK